MGKVPVRHHELESALKQTIADGRRVLEMESRSVSALIDRLNASFRKAVEILAACKGSVVVTGMGKSGLIGRKIAATLSSTGTASKTSGRGFPAGPRDFC